MGHIDARELGVAAAVLGAGRFKKDDVIDPRVGILMKKRCGDKVSEGEPFAVIYANDEAKLRSAKEMIEKAISITEEKPGDLPLVYDVIE